MDIYIVTFKHGNYAVAAFSKLQSLNINNIKLSQVPFSIKSECDLCLKVYDTETLKFLLRECRGKFPVDNVYSAIRQNGNGMYIYKLLPIRLD